MNYSYELLVKLVGMEHSPKDSKDRTQFLHQQLHTTLPATVE